MTKELKQLREIICKELPEIKRLEFGCVVKHKLFNTEAIIIKNALDYFYRVYEVGLSNSLLRWRVEKSCEIIGRPIRLADVLRVFSSISLKELHIGSPIGTPKKELSGIMLKYGKHQMLWKLGYDLDDQSPETINLLLKLLSE